MDSFLGTKFKELAGSHTVERAVVRVRGRGETLPDKRDVRIKAYLDRLLDIASDSRGFNRLKNRVLSRYCTKYEEIPESFWQSKLAEVRARGEGADWGNLTEQEQTNLKRQQLETVLTDQ